MHPHRTLVGGVSVSAAMAPPWHGIVGIGGFVALGIAIALVALVQRRPQVEAQPAGA